LEGRGILLATAKVVDDRAYWKLEASANSLVLKEERGVVQLILQDQIEGLRAQPFQQIPSEVIQ
jgi:hypothetical protein